MARHRLDLARGRKRLLRGGGSWSRKAMHAVIGWFALVCRSVFMVDRAATVAPTVMAARERKEDG